MQARGLRKVRSAHVGTLFQLFVSHLLVGVCVLLAGRFSGLVALAGGLMGMALTWNIASSLHVLEVVLDRLAHGRALEPPAPRWHWPLSPLFTRVNALISTAGKLLVDPQAATYRDQLSLQVSKTAAQEERNRLARDLHDSIKQQIFSVVMSAAAVKARWSSDPAGALLAIEDIERTAQEAQVEMQVLLQELRPVALENVGLIESLRMQCQALGYRTGAQVSAELGELPAEELLPLGAQELIFRIVQEGFANIARHARAEQVWLSLRRQGEALLVEIGDDGQGFALEEKPKGFGGMGLANIRERARSLGGQATIWSQVGAGTTLHLYLPLVQEAEAQQAAEEDEQVQVANARARSWLNVGIRAVELLALSVILAVPHALIFFLLSVGLPLVAWCWLWSQRYRVQVTLGLGRRSALHTALLATSSALLAGLVLLLLTWLIYAYPLFFAPGDYPWLLLAAMGAGAGLCVAAAIRSLFDQGRYYRSLPASEVYVQARQRLQYLAVDALVWALLTGLVLVLMRGHLDRTIFASWDLQADPGLLYLGGWLCVLCARVLQTLRWRGLAGRKAANG